MAEKNSYPHKDHRKRVRDAFRKAEKANLPDRALLEMLLFYSVPRRDTDCIAGRLLEKYGTLAAVLSAPAEELEKVEGMGESSALLLSLIPEIGRRYENKSEPVKALTEPDELMNFISGKFASLSKETFMIICLDPVGRATECRALAEGDTGSVTVDKRAILETAFAADADSVILAHNHPEGESAPSSEDIELTKEIGRLLAETGIKLRDHIIVGASGPLSLASTDKFSNLFF